MPEQPVSPEPGRFRRALRFLARWTLRLALVGAVAGAVGGYFGWRWFEREILSTLPPELGRDAEFRIPCSVQVFDAAGQRVDEFYLERRVWVPIGELPPHVGQAFVASEDRRFFEHQGVDPIGIARALVVNLRGGETRQGGSTITQQLVKNLLVGKERSYRRKLREAVLAYRLDAELDKMQLLELYVNYVALGSGNYGVEAAARDYFGVSAREIDAGQAALLAGLVPAPSRYSPRSDPDLAASRREIVLRLMAEQGYLPAEEASRFLTDPVLVPRVSANRGANTAYLTEARREVRRIFGQDLPFLEGLQVHTALDVEVQREVEAAVREGLTQLEARQGARAPTRNLGDAERAAFLQRGDGLRVDPATGALADPRPGDCFPAVATGGAALAAGPFAFTLAPTDLAARVRTGPGKPPAPLAQVLRPGDVLDVCALTPEAGETRTVHRRARPWAEAAAVVLENHTGHVVAIAGGYDPGLEGFIRATQARRQPGSAFKPFVYAAAVADGLRQTDLVVDAPFSLPGTNGRPWSPKNYDGRYRGAIPLRTALALSLNTVAVRLGYDVGIERVTTLARDLGVTTPLRKDLTVFLGSSEVTPMDLALGYSSLARMGVRSDPVYLTRVLDRSGRLLAKEGERVKVPGAGERTLPGGRGERVMDPATAYVTVDMMRNVFTSGTAKRGRVAGLDFAGKTGTTSNFVDAWFVGYSPRYTVAVWVGTDGTASIGDKETGGKAALPVWSRIMAALPNVPGERFPVPDDVVLLPSGESWLGFARGTVPAVLLDVPTLEDDAPLPPFGFGVPIARAADAPPPEAPPLAPPALAPAAADPTPTGDLEAGAGDPEGALPPAEPDR